MQYLSAVVPISEKKIPSNGGIAVEEEKKLAARNNTLSSPA